MIAIAQTDAGNRAGATSTLALAKAAKDEIGFGYYLSHALSKIAIAQAGLGSIADAQGKRGDAFGARANAGWAHRR